MKKRIIILATIIASASILINGCSKNEVISNENNTKTVEFNATSCGTKTAFTDPTGTTYPTLWTANDENVKILQNVGGSPVSADVTPSLDKKTAKFTATITSDGSGSYTFYAASPASAFTSYQKAYKSWNVTIKGNQTPSEKSVDEGAQLLAAKSSTYTPDFPTNVNLSFTHVTAYGKFSLTNLGMVSGENITTVKLTSAVKWVGSCFYYIADYDTHVEGEVATASTASTELTINTNSPDNIWFACAPVDLSGTNLDVLVTTNKATYTKTFTLSSGREFQSGRIKSFTLDMTGAVKDVAPAYSLIPTAGSDNGYATSEDIEVSGITWNVTGNSTFTPWRIGGKNLSGVNRAIYSKTAITNNVNKIVITHGTASSVTVNSMTVYVCSTAAGAAADTPTNVVASFTPSFVASDNVTINKADETSWANCYYRIVYNLTIGSSNKYLQFSEAKFYD